MSIKKIKFQGAGVTAAIDGGDPEQMNVVIPGGSGGSLIEDCPADLRYCGDKSGGAFVSSGPITLDGEHHFTSFNLQPFHTITVGPAGFLVIRVCGPCTIAGIINASGAGAGHDIYERGSLGTDILDPWPYTASAAPQVPSPAAGQTFYTKGLGSGGGSGGGSPKSSAAPLNFGYGFFHYGSPSVFMGRVVAPGGNPGWAGFLPQYPTPGTTPPIEIRRAIMSIGHRAVGAAGATDALTSARRAEGHGGGYVLIVADALTFTGVIEARGGTVHTGLIPDGPLCAPGGGGGGVIIMSAKTYPVNIGTLDVSGGAVIDDAGVGVGAPNAAGGAGWTHTQIIP